MSEPALLPVPEGLRMVYTHLHGVIDLYRWSAERENEGTRSSRRDLPRYVTIARLLDDEDQTVWSGEAVCSHRDNPSRKLGRVIAHNRCIAGFMSWSETHG